MKHKLLLVSVFCILLLVSIFPPLTYGQGTCNCTGPGVLDANCKSRSKEWNSVANITNPDCTAKDIPTCTCKVTCTAGADYIWTALGCIPTGTNDFVVWVLKFAIAIGGGIAILLIISGAFQVMTSSGNPESIKKGTGMITSAIGGLIFIIFSLFLLKLIGVDILNIPGLTP